MDILFPDGHKESHFTLDSIIRLPQGLPHGNYQVEYFVNGQNLESRKWRISIPLLQNPLFYTALSLLVIGLFYFGFRYRSRQKDMERKLLDSRMKLLKKNLDPHFIFNSLNLSYMLLMQGKYDEAKESILKFSDLHRYFLEMINKSEVSLAEEFKFLQNYLELELGRLDADSAFQFTIENTDVDIDGIMIPPMILQPLVENAIKYCGLTNSEVELRKILIESYLIEGHAVVSIENTVSSDALHFSHRLGKGISIVQQMIDIYNRNSGGQITFMPSVECKHFKGGYRCEISMRL
jgi:LytS/YehU family sensor histidine kinase